MNRILVHLESVESRRRARVAALRDRCETIEERCQGLVEFVIEDDMGGVLVLLRDPFDRDAVPLESVVPTIVSELRKLSELATVVAGELEGGAA